MTANWLTNSKHISADFLIGSDVIQFDDRLVTIPFYQFHLLHHRIRPIEMQYNLLEQLFHVFPFRQ
jgi:hypothetical protein